MTACAELRVGDIRSESVAADTLVLLDVKAPDPRRTGTKFSIEVNGVEEAGVGTRFLLHETAALPFAPLSGYTLCCHRVSSRWSCPGRLIRRGAFTLPDTILTSNEHLVNS